MLLMERFVANKCYFMARKDWYHTKEQVEKSELVS
jgi:hypothetical protein